MKAGKNKLFINRELLLILFYPLRMSVKFTRIP